MSAVIALPDAGMNAFFRQDAVEIPFDRLSDTKNHSAWRQLMAERIATEMDCESFGIKSVHLIGSVERGDAGLCSDIDLLIHVDDDQAKRRLLELWLEGWGKALALTNYLRTGFLADSLLDAYIVTDKDIQDDDPFAALIRNPLESCCLLARSRATPAGALPQ